MLDEVTAEIALPQTPSPDWRADLRAIARASWDTIMRHSWYAQLVHARPPLGPNTMRRTEHILETLTRHGATAGEAMTYAALLDRHIFGGALQAAEERDTRSRHALTNTDELTTAIIAARKLAAYEGSYPIPPNASPRAS